MLASPPVTKFKTAVAEKMDLRGFDPRTSSLLTRRTTDCSTNPDVAVQIFAIYVQQSNYKYVVVLSVGGENGFNQAIELSSDTLANVKFVQEKRLISKFFDEISQDTGKYVFGVKDTLACLEMGAVETLIVWENLDVNRFELMNSSSGEVVTKMLSSQQVDPWIPLHVI